MKISELEVGTEYLKTSNYDKPSQKVRVLEILKDEVMVQFTSNDYSKGLLMNFNRIECERYLTPIK